MPQSCSTLKGRSMQKSQQHMPPSFSTLKAQVVQEQVQPTPMNSSTVVAQVSENQLQHVPKESPTIEADDIQYQVQQETQNLKENDLSGEQELGSFLGTLARNVMLCPLNIHNWKNMDTKKDLWDYAQALEGIRNAWRKYRNDLYENHYKAYDNDDLRMANKPKDVSEFDFKDLLKYWDFEKFKEKEKESPDELSAKELFVATRSRKPG
ncbi:hypothetical protein H5410_028129 [Solanum commersonii]|uniref:Uncharacterized protein n=1 Tax=Solanum commersonii TaxID=4109 RepID=A0A9J5Z361_SOLCO|nr:hypothetical protein H5410_028129 [Solanum commersonii]